MQLVLQTKVDVASALFFTACAEPLLFKRKHSQHASVCHKRVKLPRYKNNIEYETQLKICSLRFIPSIRNCGIRRRRRTVALPAVNYSFGKLDHLFLVLILGGAHPL